MGLTRASLLKRALVGGLVVTFGKLPDTLADMPPIAPPAVAPEAFTAVRIANVRTAIPSAARLTNVSHARVLDEQIALLEPDTSPLLDLMNRQSQGMLGTYTAQRVDWLEDEIMPRSSAVLFDGEIGELTVSEPKHTRYFLPGDIIRNEHDGDLLHVDAEIAPHTYRVHHIGASDTSYALVDAQDELYEMAASLPRYEPIRRFKNSQFG